MNTQCNKPRKPMLPVLMYHGLHAGQHARGRYDSVYSVHPDEFARQLDWLLDSGHHTVRINPTLAQTTATTGTRRPVLITFDDGDVSNIEVAMPRLLERGMAAEFFITSDFIDQPGMLSSRDVRSLADAGMGIGAHGKSHRFLEDLDQKDLEAELEHSRLRLSSITVSYTHLDVYKRQLQNIHSAYLPNFGGGLNFLNIGFTASLLGAWMIRGQLAPSEPVNRWVLAYAVYSVISLFISYQYVSNTSTHANILKDHLTGLFMLYLSLIHI